MKRIKIITLTVIVVFTLLLLNSTAMAAKPDGSDGTPNVIAMSNGFPSGDHETLNIHGKQAGECTECVPGSIDPVTSLPVQCNVVDVPEFGTANISYVSGRKVNIAELTVFDSCAGFDSPSQEDGAEVWLPYEAQGYYVFARALGKPAKGDPSDPGYVPRRIIFENAGSDNPIVYSLFGEVTGPDDVPLALPLGLITSGGTYELMSTDDAGINLVRFDSEPTGKGRGKTLGKNITDMFMWSGTVYQPILDLNGDGAVSEADVPLSYDADSSGTIDSDEFNNWLADNQYGYVFPPSLDLNGDGVVNEADVPLSYDADSSGTIDSAEFINWAKAMLGVTDISVYWIELWHSYETPVWVFTIADLVYQNQVVTNEGIKNLQIRFYPVATTSFSTQSTGF